MWSRVLVNMSFSVLDDDSVEGLDPIVLSLEEFSREVREFYAGSNAISCPSERELCGWIAELPRNGTCKISGRRSAPSKDVKDQLSCTTRRSISRQLWRHKEDSVEFQHYLQSNRYIEEYRNDKISRQAAALRELLNRNERSRGSGGVIECRKTINSREHFAAKHSPTVVSMKEVQSADGDNADKPFIVVSSKRFFRPSNLPRSGHFQGRKLQSQPTVKDRKIHQSRVSQWSQAHTDVTLEISSHGTGDVSHIVDSLKQNEDCKAILDRQPSGNLVVKRTELNASSTPLRVDNRSLNQPSHERFPQQRSAIEKCDAWVRNRDNELGSIKGHKNKEHLGLKARGNCRTLTTPQAPSPLIMRGNTLPSAQKDSSNFRITDGSTNLPSSSDSMGMDYSQYTDMFKNVLEFYGTRRLRPKSHSAVEQLLSMKS